MTQPSYLPIFWDPDWAHERYYGWSLHHQQENLRVLRKKQGPVARYLVMSHQLSDTELGRRLPALKITGPLSMVWLHDFTAQPVDQLPLAGRWFRRANHHERLLNIHTFVLDLVKDQEELWQAMKSDNRRMCRKALESGMMVEVSTSPEDGKLSAFLDLYHKLAIERNLALPDRTTLSAMLEQGNLVIFSTILAGVITCINLIYCTKNKAYYLYGVGGNKGDGSGQLIQWETMKFLKERGIRWYDLGGVAETDSANGIFLFKRSFGGQLVHLGGEYLHCPPLLAGLMRLRERWRR